MNELKIEYLSPDELTPYEGNARKHSPDGIEAIKKSILDDGFNDPIGVWGENNLIVEGHGWQIAAKELHLEKIPVIRLDHLTDKQRREYAIRHNKTAELSAWDFGKLEEELSQLSIFSNVILIISTQIALLYIPSEFDYADGAMRTLFSLNLRISLASAAMYYIANMADIYIFGKIKKKTNGKKLWLRNNVATILCNCLENFGFIGLAFAGIYDFGTIITIAVSTSIIEAIVAVLDTPFLYLARKV